MENGSLVIKKILSGDLLLQSFDVYMRAFQSIRERSPVREAFDEHELRNTLRSPHSHKLIYIINGRVAGIGFLTNRYSRIFWANHAYFAHRFPDHHKAGKIYFIEGMAVDPELQHQGIVTQIINGFIEFTASRKAILVGDMAKRVSDLGIPETTLRLCDRYAYRGSMIGEQIFFVYAPHG